MRLYLDCCCYNRPFDDLSQIRVNLESKAIMFFVKLALSGFCVILGSEILDIEISKIKSPRKIIHVKKLYSTTTEYIPLTEEIINLAENIRSKTSIHLQDSLQVASAEIGKADVFLTTDDKLIRMCQNIDLHLKVMNPLTLLKEVAQNVGIQFK